jgi:glutamate synthase domain-containing protein 3
MRSATGVVTVAVVLGAAACGDSGAPPTDQFVGTWNATKMEFTRVADPTVKQDIIALGAAFQITFAADSTWEWVLTVPGDQPDTSSGTWAASLDVLTIMTTGQSGEMMFAFVLSGNVVTLTGASADWDFGTGIEAATLSITATKQ